MSPYKPLLVVTLAFTCCTAAFSQGFAARVNGQPISTERVKQLMGAPTASTVDAEVLAARRVGATQALVRQTVLVQAAVKDKFDQNPSVQLSLAQVKYQSLAEAYLATALGAGTRPTEADIDRFIANNPLLFEQRQTFHYHRIEVPYAPSINAARLDEILRLNKDALDMAQALRRGGIDFRLQSLWQGAEQVEPELLKRLQGMANRSVMVVDQAQAGRWVVLQRNAAYSDPVDTRAVRPAIARGLFAEQREARVAALVRRFRSEAKIKVFDGNSETAATVNGQPISKQTLDHRLRERALPTNTPVARQSELDQLIDLYLLSEQAQKEGMGQQPGLSQRIEQMQEASLAAQYLERSASAQATAAGEREIVQFVNSRPVFFAQRKIYHFEETLLAQPAKESLEITRTALTGLNDAQVQRWLDETGAVVGRNSPWLSPEKLAPPYLAALSEMKPGERRVLAAQNDKAIAVLHLRSVHNDPFDAEQARLVAINVLRQQARARAAEEFMEKLMAKADIEYAQDFKPRDVVRLTTVDWGKREWAGFAAWTAHFTTLVLLVVGLGVFWKKSRQRMMSLAVLQHNAVARNASPEVAIWRGVTRSRPFIAALALCLLVLAGLATLLEWNVVRSLVAKERLIAGAAGGSVLGVVLTGMALVLTRGVPPRLRMGRWTVVLVPAAAILSGVALVSVVLGR